MTYVIIATKKRGGIVINITTGDIKELSYIGSGKFGKVYKKDDNTAYKIYHETVADDYSGRETINPIFYLPKRRYNLLISRSKNLKYSGGIKDIIYVNGRFGGVAIPYYDGRKLNDLMNKPLKLRIDLSRQILNNGKELTTNLIFPTDYKLNNMILSNGSVQIIDLDDNRTHVCVTPSIVFRSFSVNALGETIQTLLGQDNHLWVPRDVLKEIKREKSFFTTRYRKIDDYLDKKEKEFNLIFIDENTDISSLKNYIASGIKIVFVLNNWEEAKKGLDIINKLKQNGIELFDFTTREKLEKYHEIESVNEEYIIEGKQLKKVFKNKN